MHFNTLKSFRQQMYGCCERSRDALFNLCDALVSEPQARSLAELSLSAFFERRWFSVYEALQDGRINTERLHAVFVQALIESQPENSPVWLGIDSSGMEPLEAASSQDRGMIYVPNLPHATKPVSVGWQFSTLMLLPDQPRSWVGVVEQRRISTEQSAIGVGIEQLRAVLPLIKRPVIVLAERWYAVGRFVCACRELHCAALMRLKRKRKLYRAAPPRKPKQRGAPCKQSHQPPLTPRQVRRVMPSILQQLGTPALPPKPRGKSPGWRKGRPRTPAALPVVKKPKPVPKTSRKRA